MRSFPLLAAVLCAVVPSVVRAAPSFAPANLTCEGLVHPLGLDVPLPRFSWQLTDTRRGAKQTAYQIRVATSPERLREERPDVWDSKTVGTDQSIWAPFGGPALESGRRYYWQVRVWDQQGKPGGWSAPTYWETGLLNPADWHAQWIGYVEGRPDPKSTQSPLLRKTFTLAQPIQSARIYVTALGSYRLSINGRRVGEDVLTPDWTDYRKRVTYQTYDVTDLLRQGENAVAAMLGDGWYGSGLGWNLQRFSFGPPPDRLLMQLQVTYADGRKETVVTDGSWKATLGPILRSEIYAGETYDARKEQPGWDRPGFRDSGWQPVTVLDAPPAALVAQRSPTIQVTQELKPRTVQEPKPGVFVFDMGQNMVGWARLRAAGPAGTSIRMRFAEILNPDGTIYTANLRRAEATDTFTLRGGGEETFEPHFTYHGFRYVELTGYPGRPGLNTILGIVFHTNTPPSGAFACSDDMVNQLWRNITWGQRGNQESVPTDCPQRDERLGWMGDAEIFSRTACFNMDMDAFYSKWMRDVVDAQSAAGGFSDVSPRVVDPADGAPAWGDAGIIIPYEVYRQYGDTGIVRDNWPAMVRWMEYIHGANPNLLWLKRRNNDFGDWVPAGSDTPKDVLATAYWAYDAQLMAEMARALGRAEEASGYLELYNGIKAAFIKAYVKDDGTVGNGSQTCQALAIHMGLLPDGMTKAAADVLVRDIQKRGGHLSTGFVGTCYLMRALTMAGHTDMAYQLLLNEDYPSWGYMIRKGATTMWERWNGDTGDPGMNSFNHYAFGAVGEWIYRCVAGIDTDPHAPGYRAVIIHPRLDSRITHARGEYESMYGKVVSDWTSSADGAFSLNVTVPANSAALVYVPFSGQGKVLEGGKTPTRDIGVVFQRMEDGCALYFVGAGTYSFTSGTGPATATPRAPRAKPAANPSPSSDKQLDKVFK